MTERKRNTFDWVWRTMRGLQEAGSGWNTAGEVAKAMGISRNTAKKYLDELIGTEAVQDQKIPGKNRQEMTVYYAVEVPADE